MNIQHLTQSSLVYIFSKEIVVGHLPFLIPWQKRTIEFLASGNAALLFQFSLFWHFSVFCLNLISLFCDLFCSDLFHATCSGILTLPNSFCSHCFTCSSLLCSSCSGLLQINLVLHVQGCFVLCVSFLFHSCSVLLDSSLFCSPWSRFVLFSLFCTPCSGNSPLPVCSKFIWFSMVKVALFSMFDIAPDLFCPPCSVFFVLFILCVPQTCTDLYVPYCSGIVLFSMVRVVLFSVFYFWSLLCVPGRFGFWFYLHVPNMNTISCDRSQISGTGPSGYGTGPRLMNNLGPVPDQRLLRKLINNPLTWQCFHPKCSERVSRDIIWDWSHGV